MTLLRVPSGCDSNPKQLADAGAIHSLQRFKTSEKDRKSKANTDRDLGNVSFFFLLFALVITKLQ